jgi:hypothetical protein
MFHIRILWRNASELFGCLKRGECGEIVQEPLRRMCYVDFDGSGGVKYMKAHPI